MEKRQLGNSGLEVAPLAFGGNVFGWTADEPTSFTLLDAFVDAGFNLIDTADVYSTWVQGHSGGESETVIGEWLKHSRKREQVLIATKVGKEMGSDLKGLSKTYILQAVEASLRRLQTDYIDLYQSHDDDPETPLEETLEAYDQLIKQGKVRAIGASNFSAQRLAESLEVSERTGYPRYESLQPLFNLYDRVDYEKELQPLCREKGLGVITYFSLASGFLTGKYRSKADLSKSARGKFVEKYINERGFRIVEALNRVGQQLNLTAAQVSLAWLISQPTITAPIASATNLDQLNELMQAATIELSPAVIGQLNQASA
ncbi:MAG: aldo/keto reductase [Deltaproteobacteria bacterium]|jgi:aryl-alcohol dehydrogenase-like predicted oxidoreductase